MIPLHRAQFPGSKAELAEVIDKALRLYVRKEEPVVTISSRVFPYLDEIAINFDRAEFDDRLPPVPRIVGETKLACEAAVVSISARDVAVQGAPVNLQIEARDVVFHEGRDEANEVTLLIDRIRTGHLVVSASQLELENAIRKIAQHEGKKNGISIEEARLALRARGPRSIAADVRLQARKFVLRANIDISAQVDMEEDFTIKLSNLKCRGEGMLGSLACGVLEPHLRQLEGKTLSLIPPVLDGIQMTDLRTTVADTVEVTADFAKAPA